MNELDVDHPVIVNLIGDSIETTYVQGNCIVTTNFVDEQATTEQIIDHAWKEDLMNESFQQSW